MAAGLSVGRAAVVADDAPGRPNAANDDTLEPAGADQAAPHLLTIKSNGDERTLDVLQAAALRALEALRSGCAAAPSLAWMKAHVGSARARMSHQEARNHSLTEASDMPPREHVPSI